jgi:hypothetical protein
MSGMTTYLRHPRSVWRGSILLWSYLRVCELAPVVLGRGRHPSPFGHTCVLVAGIHPKGNQERFPINNVGNDGDEDGLPINIVGKTRKRKFPLAREYRRGVSLSAFNMGMLKKSASGVLALLPCSRTGSTLRAPKGLRPYWTDPRLRGGMFF